MAEKIYTIKGSTLTGMADALRSGLGDIGPIKGDELEARTLEVVGMIGSGGGGGGSLPAGVYLSSAPPGVSPTYYRHRLFWFKGELYAIANNSISSGNAKAIYKWDGSAWTTLLSTTSTSGINSTNLDSTPACVEYNDKMHFIASKVHCVFDGTALTLLNPLPESPIMQTVFLYQGKIVVWGRSTGTLYEWDETTDTWTSLQVSLGDDYSTSYFFVVGGELYAVNSKKVYHYVNGAMEQISVADCPTIFYGDNAFVYNGCIYYIAGSTTATDVYRYNFDTNEWEWVSDIRYMGLMFFTSGGAGITFSAPISNGSSHYFVDLALHIVEATE